METVTTVLHIVGTASVLVVSLFILVLSLFLREKQPLRSRGALHHIVLGVISTRSVVLLVLHLLGDDNEVLECYLDIFVADPFTVLVSSMLLSQSVRYLITANSNQFKYTLLGIGSEEEATQNERSVEMKGKLARLHVLHKLSKTRISLLIAAVLVAILMGLSVGQVVSTNGQCVGSEIFGYVQLVWDILVRVIAILPLVYDLVIRSKHFFTCHWRRLLMSNDPHLFRIELLFAAIPFILAGVYEGLEQAFPEMDENFPPLQALVEYSLQLWLLITFCGFSVACTVGRTFRERTAFRSKTDAVSELEMTALGDDELLIQALLGKDEDLQDMFDRYTACEKWCGELLLFHRELKPIASAIKKYRDLEEIPPETTVDELERLRQCYVAPSVPLTVDLSVEARDAFERSAQLLRSIRAAAADKTPGVDNNAVMKDMDDLVVYIETVQSEMVHQLRELAERFMLSSPYKNHMEKLGEK